MFIAKRIQQIIAKQLLYVAACAFFVACSSSAVIRSYPSNARVSVGDSVIGSTPVKITDFRPNGANLTLKLELENHQTIFDTISRNDNKELSIYDFSGAFLLFPLFWSNSYQKNYLYYLLPSNADSAFAADSLVKQQILQDLLNKKAITPKQYEILKK